MKHGLKGPFVKLTFVQTTFGNLEKRLPDLGMTGNAVTFGGLLVMLPSEERFREFRARLGMPA